MLEKTLRHLIEKNFTNPSNQSIQTLLNLNQNVVSDRSKHSDDGFKYFIGYQEGEIVKPLCIILPQMSGYIKYFENSEKKYEFYG